MMITPLSDPSFENDTPMDGRLSGSDTPMSDLSIGMRQKFHWTLSHQLNWVKKNRFRFSHCHTGLTVINKHLPSALITFFSRHTLPCRPPLFHTISISLTIRMSVHCLIIFWPLFFTILFPNPLTTLGVLDFIIVIMITDVLEEKRLVIWWICDGVAVADSLRYICVSPFASLYSRRVNKYMLFF